MTTKRDTAHTQAKPDAEIDPDTRERVDLNPRSNQAEEQTAGARLRALLWNDTVQTIVYAIVIAMVVRVFAFEPFNIPSSSMYPTLLVGDYLFVSKYSYGYSRYSFPWSLAPIDGRIWEGAPERGDVAVFKEPVKSETDYIKRVVGLPGDRIQVVHGVLNINGVPVGREQIEDFRFTTESGRTVEVPQYIETLPNGRRHRILEMYGDDYLSASGKHDDTPEIVVPAGHYFMMGDNRDNSADSRVIGTVPAENLIGRAEILFFSTDGSARFWQVWRWPFAIRYGRLLESID